MLDAGYSILSQFIACLITGFIMKLMDDFIDKDIFHISSDDLSKPLIETAIFPYSILALAIAAGINVEYTVTLTASCYMIGMFHDLHMKLPTGLSGYGESIILFIMNIYLFSLQSITTSLIAIFLIQCMDDLQDIAWDKKYGYKNFVLKFGKVEIILVSLILATFLILFDYNKLFIVLLSSLIIQYTYKKVYRSIYES